MICFAKKYVPELSESCGELWARFERESEKPSFQSHFGLKNRPHAIFITAVWGYYVLIIMLHNFYGPEAMSGYFSLFEFIPEFASHFSRMQENLTEGLINVGYPHMVPLTSHAYSVAHVGTILWIISLTCLGNMKMLGTGTKPAVIKNRGSNWAEQKKQITMLFLLGAFTALTTQIVGYEIDCDAVWNNICQSQFNYYGYLIVDIMFFFLVFSYAYSSLLISMLITSPLSYGFKQNQNGEV